MMNTRYFVFKYMILAVFSASSQPYNPKEFAEKVSLLGLDTTYAFFQYHDSETAERFSELFKNSKEKRVVLFHHGASHIQAEVVTSTTRELLQDKFGHAGPGFLFPFSAARTYSNVNYRTLHQGKWSFDKSYQIPPKIPLGVRGMTIETTKARSSISLLFNETIPPDHYELIVFFDNNELTPDFEVKSGEFVFRVNDSVRKTMEGKHYVRIDLHQPVDDLLLTVLPTDTEPLLFRFYGFSLEKKDKKGLLYHPLGVGGSPFEAVLHMEKLKEQAAILEPDIVLLDYGTNNILYRNAVPTQMASYVAEAINIFREINPDIIVVLTSPQDLFYKGRYIDAAVSFTSLMDSLSRVHNCMYWNYYDLSGGFEQIRNWRSKGYAQNDHIHLTKQGYTLKGYMLFKSITNTLQHIISHPDSSSFSVPVKNYEELVAHHIQDIKRQRERGAAAGMHVVRSGDTLSGISRKYGISVNDLKRINKLSGDLIKIGQVLRVSHTEVANTP